MSARTTATPAPDGERAHVRRHRVGRRDVLRSAALLAGTGVLAALAASCAQPAPTPTPPPPAKAPAPPPTTAPAPAPTATAAPAKAPAPAPTPTSAPVKAPAPAPTPTTAAPAKPSAGAIELNWWHWWPGAREKYFNENLIPMYRQKYPNVTITQRPIVYANYPQSLKTALAAGEGPDLFGFYPISMMSDFVNANLVEDLSQYIKGEWRARFVESILKDLCSVRGKLYVMPFAYNSRVHFFRKDIFQQNGLAAPKTTDDLIKAAKVLKARGIVADPLGNKDPWPGGDLFFLKVAQTSPGKLRQADAGETKWDSTEFVKAFQVIRDLRKEEVYPAGANATDGNQMRALLVQGKAAIGWTFTGGQVAWYTDDKEFASHFEMMPYPQIPGASPSVGIGGLGVTLTIAKASKFKNEAVAVLDLATDEPYQRKQVAFGDVPALTKLFDQINTIRPDDPIQAFGAKQQGTVATRELYTPELLELLRTSVQELLDLKISAEEAAAKLEKTSKATKRTWV
ncbi:MAG: extracellular solute-binding protein [Chloroflexi bacterium]|nr:extracellular solute-binding protein [Chloroflexota bacterium]